MDRPTVLCLASYEKGEEFLRTAVALEARTHLVTVERLAEASWPREGLAGVHALPDLQDPDRVLRSLAGIVWEYGVDAIVALDEFDLETAAAAREHYRVGGMGETATRRFRDKLAMREGARDGDIRVPEFVSLTSSPAVRRFVEEVPAPWVLKPRTSASTMGIRTVADVDALWRALESLGPERAFYLLERFVPGDVFHVDGLFVGGRMRLTEAHRYAAPPLRVYHEGGLFCTRTLERGSAEAQELGSLTGRVLEALGLVRGPFHAEFIRSDGAFYFLEVAARVGGAHIADVVEAATGINLWTEWARMEVGRLRGKTYETPPRREDIGAALVTLARQEWPDTSAYDAPEVVLRVMKRHHAGLILRSPDPRRLDALLHEYADRFYEDFHARLPPLETPDA